MLGMLYSYYQLILLALRMRQAQKHLYLWANGDISILRKAWTRSVACQRADNTPQGATARAFHSCTHMRQDVLHARGTAQWSRALGRG